MIDEICSHKFCAEEQKKHEIERLGNDSGCAGYKKMGCYDCDGRNSQCYAYTKSTEAK